MQVDVTIGPAFPAMVPGLSPNGPGSAKELVYGLSEMIHSSGPAKVHIPVPMSRPTGVTPANAEVQVDLTLLGLYAVRTNAQLSKSGALLIETSTSSEDMSFDSSIKQLETTDPRADIIEVDLPALCADQAWIIVAVYARGTAQVRNSVATMKAARCLSETYPLRPKPYSSKTPTRMQEKPLT